MSYISNFAVSFHGQRAAFNSADAELKFPSLASIHCRPTIRIARPFFRNDTFSISRMAVGRSSRVGREGSVHMALVNERLGPGRNVSEPSSVLAYELLQGKLVKWSSMVVLDRSIPEPPTAVLLHGILGSRKNWEFPTWQFVLIYLRCHGDSASIKKRGPHTVASTALDVLKLIAQLRITPRVLIGHSFGGKVVLSMVEQAAKPFPRPVRVSLKQDIVDALVQEGFPKDVAQWVVTNLRPTAAAGTPSSSFSWVFDLEGISKMYQSYEETNLWEVVENLPRGVHKGVCIVGPLKIFSESMLLKESAADEGGGVEMHVLEDAGHW
ncbi:Alpha/beta hydrolase fold-1 - like 10, partial [Theobroma cacao]